MGDYGTWRDLIVSHEGQAEFRVSFEELENQLGKRLPAEARSQTVWWSSPNPHAVWSEQGFIAIPDLFGEYVDFVLSATIKSAAALPSDPWLEYDKWNEAVRDRFFSGQFANRPVYLDVEDQTLADLSNRAGGHDDPRDAFRKAVADTLNLGVPGKSVFFPQTHRLRAWRRDGRRETPPFLAMLAFLVRAAEEMRGSGTMRSNNYMGRLASLLDIDTGHERNRMQASFREQTPGMWHALNDWLDSHDGALGIPTARVWNWKVYVGLPISQAVLKAVDCDALAERFHLLKLRPGQQLSPTDMQRVLADWLPHGGFSEYIKTLWRSGKDGQTTIAEAACVELENWDGSLPSGAAQMDLGPPAGELAVWARFQRHPAPRITLGLVARAPFPLPLGEYSIHQNGSEYVKEALGPGQKLEVLESEGSTSFPIRQSDAVSIPDVLLRTLSVVEGEGEGVTLTRYPRSVVVLEKDEELGTFVEVERAQLSSDTMVMAHGSWADKVHQALVASARRGFDRMTPKEVAGLPHDWELFSRVELIWVPDVEEPDLGALVPLSRAGVTFGGGLKLPGQHVFHRLAPPEVRVHALDDDHAAISLTCHQVLDDSESYEESTELGVIVGSGNLALPLLPDGDYGVEIVRISPTGRRTSLIASNWVRIRSGDWPRYLESLNGMVVGHRVDTSGLIDPIGAAETQSDDVGVMGASVSVGLAEHRLPIEVPPEIDATASGAGVEDDSGPAPSSAPRVMAGAACVMTGAHHWMLPAAGPTGLPKWFTGRCKNCQIEKGFPKRPRDMTRPTSALKAGKRETSSLLGVEPITPSTTSDYDLLLDSLSYAGSGAWAAFGRLADQMSDLPWFAAETSRLLSALGHIDIIIEAKTMRPKAWSVAPPTLVSLADHTALLCGYRSSRLMSAIEEVTAALGGRFEVAEQAEAPRRVTLAGLDSQELWELAQEVEERSGVAMDIAVRSGQRLSAALPSMRAVAQKMRRQSTPLGATVRRYDPLRNEWVDHVGLMIPGAYRFLTRPVTYGVITSDTVDNGEIIVVDNRWAKWVAAADQGWGLMAYDPRTHTLTTPLGAQLPGILERAVTLSSGLAPVRTNRGTIMYRSVPSDVAGRVWSAIVDAT